MELPNFKKILLLVSIAIGFYIIYSLVQRRQTLMTATEDVTDVAENFQTSMATIVPTVNLQYSLKEYLMFSAWNCCAVSDGNVSLEQLAVVFQNGCRFLDFEVYFIDNKPVIGFSKNKFNQNESIQQIDSDKVIPFIDVCTAIASATSPNQSDPLFLHFRIKTKNLKILDHMAENFISSGLGQKFYKEKVDEYTILSKLQNKIVIVVDKAYVPLIKEDGMKNMINMFSSMLSLNSMVIDDRLCKLPRPLSLNTENETNVFTVKMVTHPFGSDAEFKNVSYSKFATLVMKHSIQIIPFKFYSNDDYLQDYKNFFSDNGHHAFITMAVAHSALSFNYDEYVCGKHHE
jgi:hypothetical protein